MRLRDEDGDERDEGEDEVDVEDEVNAMWRSWCGFGHTQCLHTRLSFPPYNIFMTLSIASSSRRTTPLHLDYMATNSSIHILLSSVRTAVHFFSRSLPCLLPQQPQRAASERHYSCHSPHSSLQSSMPVGCLYVLTAEERTLHPVDDSYIPGDDSGLPPFPFPLP